MLRIIVSMSDGGVVRQVLCDKPEEVEVIIARTGCFCREPVSKPSFIHYEFCIAEMMYAMGENKWLLSEKDSPKCEMGKSPESLWCKIAERFGDLVPDFNELNKMRDKDDLAYFEIHVDVPEGI